MIPITHAGCGTNFVNLFVKRKPGYTILLLNQNYFFQEGIQCYSHYLESMKIKDRYFTPRHYVDE